MEKLKKWAEKLNNREYREELTNEEIQELKKDGIIAVYGASDDLYELAGAVCYEFSCWRGGTFVYIEERDCFVRDNYYKNNPDELIQIDLSARPFIKVSSYSNNGWKYELPNISQMNFNILENGEQYCEGKLFYLDDFINWRKS